MEILYSNLNILDIRSDGRDNTKKQCSCISIVIPSKTEWLGKEKSNQHKGYYRSFYFQLLCSYRMRYLK